MSAYVQRVLMLHVPLKQARERSSVLCTIVCLACLGDDTDERPWRPPDRESLHE